ncbi:cytochrome P450 [Nonomuraea muscovyensis]|uniref:cytochrome P450 n=1 Tax=Nonomuraea muscovyensis TaxID=1124761 RepID=UPI0033F58C32
MARVGMRLPERFDALDPAVIEDPYPTYERLRAQGPLCRMGPASFGVTRYADVAALVRDPRLGSEFPPLYHEMSAGDGPAAAFFQRIILYRDPPAHTRLRRLMSKAFSPGLVRGLREHIGDLVDELLDPAAERGWFDAVEELAFPLPVLVVCELMGIPRADRSEVRPHALNLSKAFAAMVPEADRADADASVLWLRNYLAELLAQRSKAPSRDLLSLLLAAREGDDRLTEEEIVDNAVFSFFAGFETTANLLASGCAALLEHPGELARLRADRGLLPTAVEEFLRYDAPIQGTARLVRSPVEVGDHTVRAGRVLVLLLGSANRDERQFGDPGRLDVGRDPNPHVSFGGGLHHCMGAALARVEGAVAFGRLLDRFGAIEPAGPALRRTNTTFRAYASVPVRVA